MRNFGSLIAVGLLCLAASRVSASTLMVDDFESPTPASVNIIGITHGNGVPMQFSGLPLTIGSQRDVKVDVQGTPKANSAQILIGHDDQLYNRGVFQVATASSPGSVITLQYDGEDVNLDALTNAQALSTAVVPEGGVTIGFLSVDAPNAGMLDVAIRLYSQDAVATYSGQIAETGTPVDFYASYDEFDVGDGFNFDVITSFEFVFNGAGLVDVDFAIDQISTTVPEPNSLVLLALAGIAALGVRRRIRR